MSGDYEILRLLAWIAQVFCLIGFSICDGLLSGTLMSMLLAGKTDLERQSVLHALAPVSLALQAWLFAAIVLLFGAWPIAYAAFFSSFQIIFLIMLPAWFARLLSLHFRNASENPIWRHNWDKSLAFSGLLLSALQGVIAGNLLKGVPFHFDSDMRLFFLGDFWGLLNPFALLAAGVCVSLLSMFGAGFLQLTTHGGVYRESRALLFKAGAAFLVLSVLAGLWITRLEGYHITTEIFPNAVSNPLNKFVKRGEGLWLDNYEHEPCLWIVPLMVLLSLAANLYFTKLQRAYWAFIAATLTVGFTALTVAVSMFPFLLPSNRSLNSSLTIWDAGASQNTLSVVVYAAALALPAMAIAVRWSCRGLAQAPNSNRVVETEGPEQALNQE